MTAETLVQIADRSLSKRCVPGVSIATVHSGAIEATCAGVRSTTTAEVVTDETVFEAASIGKAFTGCIAVAVAEDGAIDLDEPLNTYTSQPHVRDSRIASVTARDALTHQTGLWRDNWNSEPYFERDPRVGFKYANEGLYYLQVAIEAATRKSLEQLAQQHLCEPLNLSSSSFVWREEYENRHADPHDIEFRSLPKWKPQTPRAPTSLHSTPTDLAHLIADLLDPQSQAKWADMLSPCVEVEEAWGGGLPDPGSWWGLGWGIQTSNPSSFWHWGWNDGFMSFVVGWPDEACGVAVMTNGMNGLWVCKDVVTAFRGEEHPAFRWLEH